MNEIIPKHSRVVRELVIVEDPKTPFALTDKGTVKEKITLGLYEERIALAYEETEKAAKEVGLPSKFDGASIREFLKEAFNTFVKDAEIGDDVDLFEHGAYL